MLKSNRRTFKRKWFFKKEDQTLISGSEILKWEIKKCNTCLVIRFENKKLTDRKTEPSNLNIWKEVSGAHSNI